MIDIDIPAIHQVVIIGGGPAGCTAAIYAARAGLSPVVYRGPQPGGQLMLTGDVENFPGYAQGVMGPVMMQDLEKQAARFGASFVDSTVSHIDFGKRPYTLTLDAASKVQSHTVIIATGASAKWLGLDAEKRLYGKGVSACAVCDGFFFRNKRVAVVGGGDSAAEEASYLAKSCEQVHLLVRSGHMRASDIMQKRIASHKNIHIHWHTEVADILGEDKLTGLEIVNKQKKTKEHLHVDGLFVAIGHTPNSAIFAQDLPTDEQGYIHTQPGTTQTALAGVFACGDVQDRVYRQAVTAAATGCMAALEAERFLEDH